MASENLVLDMLNMNLRNSEASPFVAIFMVTYNHDKYIAQAIESVLVQKTTFPYLLVIGEDFSTDRTLNICKKFQSDYPNKILLKENTRNVGAMENALAVYKECIASKAKYVALLEGDDYWTDEYKLQKQIDLLENHSNLVGCFSDTLCIDNKGEFICDAIQNEYKRQITIQELSTFWIPTASVCFRSAILEYAVGKKEYLKVHNGDMYLYFISLQFGNFGYVPTAPCVYRQHQGGTWSQLKQINQYRKNLESDFIILDSLQINFKHHLITRIENNLSWQLSYLRSNEHISQIWSFFGSNFRKLLSRGLFKTTWNLLMRILPVFLYRIGARTKRLLYS